MKLEKDTLTRRLLTEDFSVETTDARLMMTCGRPSKEFRANMHLNAFTSLIKMIFVLNSFEFRHFLKI